MKIEWAEPPAPRATEWQREFAAALRKHPGKWAKWPREYTNPSSVSAIRHNLTGQGGVRRTPVAFREGVWEAVVRQGVLYVRYTGTGDTAPHAGCSHREGLCSDDRPVTTI